MFKQVLSLFSRRPWTGIGLVLGMTVFAYWPVLKCDFVDWDDDVHLFKNIDILSLDQEHISDIFKNRVNDIYIPLTSLSFAIEHHFFGFNPFVYHLDNLLLHLAVVFLVFRFALGLGLSPPGAVYAALLFGVHPMHVESVAWVTERKDVLYAALYMAALLSYGAYVNSLAGVVSVGKKAGASSRCSPVKSGNYGLLVSATLLGILSMLAKPMAVSLPLIWMLIDWFKKRPWRAGVFVEKIPLVMGVMGFALLTYLPHARMPGQGLLEGALIWAWTFTFYLRQFLFPFIFVPVYQPVSPVSFLHHEYAFSAMAMAAFWLAMICLRRYRWLVLAGLFYFFSIFFLLRFDVLKDTNIVADRFMYLPSLGFCILAGAGIERLRGYAAAVRIGMVIFIIFCGYQTFRQSGRWQNTLTLWQHQLRYYPQNSIALNNLANFLRNQKEYKEAERKYRQIMAVWKEGSTVNSEALLSIQRVNHVVTLYQRAVISSPNFIDALHNLAQLNKDLGNYSEASAYYQRALAIDPVNRDALFGLGDVFREKGNVDSAIAAYRQILLYYPQNEDVCLNVIRALNQGLQKNSSQEAYVPARQEAIAQLEALIMRQPRATSFFNLGCIYGEIGDTERAVAAYEKALEINPQHAKTLCNLANVYRDMGRTQEAIRLYQRAIRGDSRNSEAHFNLGILYDRQGDAEQAKRHFEKASSGHARSAQFFLKLAYLEEIAGDKEKAVSLYQQSIQIDPGNAQAHYNLGNVYAAMGKGQEAMAAYLRAVDFRPSHMDAWVNLSILSFHLKDYARAVEYCDQAVILGYDAPEKYLETLEPYRKPRE